MKAFCVDFQEHKHSLVFSSYVEAEDRPRAEIAFLKYFKRVYGYRPFGCAAFPIDEIPLDCIYINSEGEFTQPKGKY
jgi:hypothetical protein